MLQYISVNYLYHQRAIKHHANLEKEERFAAGKIKHDFMGKVALKPGKF